MTRRRMTAGEMAKLAGLAGSTVRYWMADDRSPNGKARRKVIELFERVKPAP